ncbi:DNA helicase [Tanacetum coccineum]
MMYGLGFCLKPSIGLLKMSDDDEQDGSKTKPEKKTVIPKVNVVKSKQQEKPVRKPVKYAEMYRSQKPRGNQRNWNNLKSQQLRSDFVMIKKACYMDAQTQGRPECSKEKEKSREECNKSKKGKKMQFLEEFLSKKMKLEHAKDELVLLSTVVQLEENSFTVKITSAILNRHYTAGSRLCVVRKLMLLESLLVVSMKGYRQSTVIWVNVHAYAAIVGLCFGNAKKLPLHHILLSLDTTNAVMEGVSSYAEGVSSYALLQNTRTNVDNSIDNGKGPYVFRISGQLYHWIGSLYPEDGQSPRFLVTLSTSENEFELIHLRTFTFLNEGCTSSADIRKINNKIYPTNKAACQALGLLSSDQEWVTTLQEASLFATTSELRRLFVYILIFCNASDPLQQWNKIWKNLSDDIPRKRSKSLRIPQIHSDEKKLKTSILFDLERMLNPYSKSLQDFGLPMPPEDMLLILQNRLLMEETNYDPDVLAAEKKLIPRLNKDQRLIFNEITYAARCNVQKLIFVYGHGGTGKTFLWKAVTSALRSEEKIVLTLADLLRQTHLIIWDEAPMNDLRCFEALDRSLKDICNRPDTFFGDIANTTPIDLQKKAIVCPKNEDADMINSEILTLVNHQQHVHLSFDEAVPHGNDGGETELLYPAEYLNSLNFSGFPPHRLELKVGAPIILLRNLNISGGLCNGTRLIVTQLLSKVIEARIITGTRTSKKVFLLRIPLINRDLQLPFIFKRKQFPVKLCYAMTINKSQGQSLEQIENFDMDEYNQMEKPVVIAIASAWATKKYGGLQLSSTSITHYYLNPNIPEATHILNTYADFITPTPALDIQRQPYSNPLLEQTRNRYTIDILLSINPHHYQVLRLLSTMELLRQQSHALAQKHIHMCPTTTPLSIPSKTKTKTYVPTVLTQTEGHTYIFQYRFGQKAKPWYPNFTLDAVLQPLTEPLLALPAAETIKSPATQVLEETSMGNIPTTTDEEASESGKPDVEAPSQIPEEKAKKTRRNLFQDTDAPGKKPRQDA